MNDQVATDRNTSEPLERDKSAPNNPVRRVSLIVVAIGVVLFCYGIAADRYTPYTAQGLVQAYLIKIAPEVGGKVVEVGVGTDQRVQPGALLFSLEPDQYMLAVRRAEAQLQIVGQTIGSSTAALATSQAKLVEAIAKRDNARDQTARDFELIKRGVYAEARRAQAQAIIDSAEAVVAQAEAEVERARQTLGPQGADNPQIREALTAVSQANLDLQRTKVLAPSEGGVTNLSLGTGQVLGKGETAMTFIDIREVWIEASFTENSLEVMAVGNPVEIVLDILPGRIFAGRVGALGYGVGNRSVDARTGLPSPRNQSGWIRPPQPMPVRIELDKSARPLRVGSQASVMVYPRDNAIMNAVGRFKIRLIALLSYVQ